MEAWQKALLAWYRENARPLPWRGEKDPYRVLVSEVLLQQTRVEQAALYYRRFLERFPTLKALAAASLEEVLRVWQGAGYYRRAEHLHRLARSVEELPPSFAELRKLPGLGPYTAAALGAFIVLGLAPIAPAHGRAVRVAAGIGGLLGLAAGWMWGVDAGVWSQALMELGATVCLPKRPRCGTCPLGAFCRGKEAPGRYPAPRKRWAKEERLVALVLLGRKGVHLERLEGRFQGLYGVPLFPPEELPGREAAFGVRSRPLGEVRHALTHRRLLVEVRGALWEGEGEDPWRRPLPKLMEKVLRKALPLLAHAGVVPLPDA